MNAVFIPLANNEHKENKTHDTYTYTYIALNKGQDLNITWEEFINANVFSDVKQIVKLSDYVMRQQGKILGHIIRAPQMDLMRQPVLGSDMNIRSQGYKRVGAPRMKWFAENCKYTCQRLHGGNSMQYGSPQHMDKIFELATNRVF